MSLTPYIQKLIQQHHLTTEEAYHCLKTIFSGNADTENIKMLLAALSDFGETPDELVGFSKAMRDHAISIPLKKPALDIVGTGGSQKNRFNISTAAAFVLASQDVPIAKHGNRGSIQPNGSFDFLEALGIPFSLSVPQLQSLFDQTNMVFLFARNHHLAMKYVTKARKELSRRTIFNLIGPLSNPAAVPFQVIGVTDPILASKIAQAVLQLGTQKTIIIAGANAIDELSTAGDSILYEVTPNHIQESLFSPNKLGLNRTEAEISGKTSTENAVLFMNLISTQNIAHPIAELICLNAGVGFYCFGKTPSIEDGFLLAKQAFLSGAVLKKFNEVRTFSESLATHHD